MLLSILLSVGVKIMGAYAGEECAFFHSFVLCLFVVNG